MPSKAKFSIKTKKEIYERDGGRCIFCFNLPTDIHHVYFGTESNYGADRNKPNQGVCLCRLHHMQAHSCSKGEGIRQRCITYVGGL